jgi:hypothetical protein
MPDNNLKTVPGGPIMAIPYGLPVISSAMFFTIYNESWETGPEIRIRPGNAFHFKYFYGQESNTRYIENFLKPGSI